MSDSSEIVILGGTGALGHKMFQRLRQSHKCLCFVRAERDDSAFLKVELLHGPDVIWGVDASDFERLAHLLQDIRPAWIINCIGIIKQRNEANAAIPNIRINSLLPHYVADLAARWNGRLIHFSTDCVFDGRKGCYLETDRCTAEDLYGLSKFLGEVSNAANTLTLRTSIIGRELSRNLSLLEWFLAQNHGMVKGFRKVIYSGVTTNFLAELVDELIEKNACLSGLYQVAAEPISKYDLLCLIRDRFGLDIEIVPDDKPEHNRSLSYEKLHRAIGYTPPAWPYLIHQLAKDSTPYDQWKTNEQTVLG